MIDSNIIVAENSGFCFGVKAATDSLEKLLLSNGQDVENGTLEVYTLGNIIHNEIYNKSLRERGVRLASSETLVSIAENLSSDKRAIVFIRAHGATKQTYKLLSELSERYPNFSYKDCTCPNVKKIHAIAENASPENNVFVLIGARNHPEVVGILSFFDGEKYVFSSEKELQSAYDSEIIDDFGKKTPILVAQTTQDLSEWKKTQKKFKKLYTNAIIFDTICNVTEKRQVEAVEISKKSDTMIVIGGKESSNTEKLYHICLENCRNTFWIQSADDLQNYIPYIHENVGIVAGASTPGNIIEEVKKIMSEIKENFAEMLEESIKTLNTGETVTGIVTQVTDAELQLDLGAKVTGIIKSEQITDDSSVKLTELFKRGDEVEAFVIRVSDVEGVAELSKKRVDSDKNWKNILASKDSGEILSGKVIEAVNGGVTVLTNSVKVFIPASQTGIPKDGDLTALLGKTVNFKVIDIKDGKRAVGSIKVVIREEMRALIAKFWDEIEIGKKYTGKVKSMTNYGVFVDLGGVDGMVHASELSWKHIKNPADVVSIGDEITVFVKEFDAEKRRISLGYKTEESNPWFIFTNTYKVEDVVSVKIVNKTPFGAFAEIIDGVDGLIHISQISNKRIGVITDDILKIGENYDAKIIEIDNEKQKVSLSIRALLEESEAEAENEAEVSEETAADETNE